MKGLVFHIQRFSVNDGPGIRTTVFFKGCLLRCRWCHNPESISPKKQLLLRKERCLECGDCMAACKQSAIERMNGSFTTNRQKCLVCGDCANVCVAEAREIVGREMTTEEVMREALKDRPFFEQSGGGITFSGGEPFFQPDFLLSLLTECRKNRVHATVDTSGFTSGEILDRIAPFVDLFLYDLKCLDDSIHQEFTGVSNSIILENLQRLAAAKNRIIVRIPLIPGVNDDPESIEMVGKFVQKLGAVLEIHVLPFHKAGQEKYARLGMSHNFIGNNEPSLSDIHRAVGQLSHYVGHVSSGG